jgi:hypothetical protein
LFFAVSVAKDPEELHSPQRLDLFQPAALIRPVFEAVERQGIILGVKTIYPGYQPTNHNPSESKQVEIRIHK